MKLPKDLPLIVWNTPDQKYHGHFHSFAKDGRVMIWPYGNTSHTAIGMEGAAYDLFKKLEEEYKYLEVVMEMTLTINFDEMSDGESEAVVDALRTLAKAGFRRD